MMNADIRKQPIHVLLLENIDPLAHKMFEEEGYIVHTEKSSFDSAELIERLGNISILGIRSKTKIDRRLLDNAPKLLAIGAFCIGTNQIDISAATQKGIAVFNAPFSNTRSVVELALCEIIMLIRGVFDKSRKLHEGRWAKTAENNFEVRGKKLGIIGYGNIGAQLSILAEALGMDVYYYDLVDKLTLGNSKKCSSMEELIRIVDIVTVHVDGRKENQNLISDAQFRMMKKGVIFLNLSRGFVVDIQALVRHIHMGNVCGAALDVFPEEPRNNSEKFFSELQNLPNVILTPHIGGSTEEAQRNIAEFVPLKIINFINTGGTISSVNLPNMQLPELSNAHRLIHLHQNVPGIMAKINHALAHNNINIVCQYLKTNDDIGYVITDIYKEYDERVIDDIRSIPQTIKFRILY